MATVVASITLVVIDGQVRAEPYPNPVEIWVRSLSVTIAVLTGFIAAAGAWVFAGVWLGRRLASRLPRAWVVLCALWIGLGAGAALFPRLHTLFARRGLGDGPVGPFPFVLAAATGVGAAILALLVHRVVKAGDQGRKRPIQILSALMLISGGGLIAMDLNILVSLYAAIHAAIELVAVLLFVTSVTLLLSQVDSGKWPRRLIAGATVLAIGWTLIFAARPGLRRSALDVLGPLGRDPVYVGRMLKRVSLAEAIADGELSDRAIAGRQIETLLSRYDVASADLSPTWTEPYEDPAPIHQELMDIREGLPKRPNIIIYYVDTLRQDTAYNPQTMPNTARFASRSMRFDRAYSTGSDTLSSLPGLIGGSYDIAPTPELTFLDVARAQGMNTTLMIPKSADEFLVKLMPAFKFDERISFEDYLRAGVWGYGADGATAGPMVDTALAWMESHNSEPFLLWLFNFDVHNWQQLDAAYLQTIGERFGLPPDDPNFKYNAAARGVDEAFGRLIAGMKQLNISDNTIVVFVSDHGETLSDSFKVHSVFLYESLVRVPLAIRVPGVPATVVDKEVSLVDVMPTLTRFMSPQPPPPHCHGEDLISYLVADRPPRKHPILFRATLNRELSRLGILEDGWKLVQQADWTDPELYDLSKPDADQHDVARQNSARVLTLLSKLVRSPMFSRVHDETRKAK